ncbi:MAG TPA: hypothetical protein VEM13_00570 [Gemmatimonadales bacterium]|nr:hypothetical protein [Gemmatimonadales bacterium]
MPKGSSKSTAVIQQLLEERRQYEAWIARLNSTADATPEGVRARVQADYEARLAAVTEELKAHASSARQAIQQKQHLCGELQKKEALVAEKLTETELRHAVGEYDEAQWSQVHRDVLGELVSVREELQAVERDIEKLQELDTLVREKPGARFGSPSAPSAPSAPPPSGAPANPDQADELAFIKSVTEDEGAAPSPRRASGAQFQPAVPVDPTRTPSAGRAVTPTPSPIVPEPPGENGDEEAAKTLRCRDCGTMNLPTEWYCEQCGAELAAV